MYHAVCVTKVSVIYPADSISGGRIGRYGNWGIESEGLIPFHNQFPEAAGSLGCRHHKRLFQEVVVIKLNETNLYSQGICCDRPKAPAKTAVFHLYEFSIPSLISQRK